VETKNYVVPRPDRKSIASNPVLALERTTDNRTSAEFELTNMKDITDPRWIKAKGLLFLVVGLLASGLLVAEHPEVEVVLLLGIAAWCFCRFYYFAFYVIERYVDPGYRFSGLWSFARYLCSRRHADDGK
jgi:hypothetical protein